MNIAKILAAIGLLSMAGVIAYAFVAGNFAEEGRMLLAMPWGIVTLVDLYTGFFLFSGWIIYREKSPGRAAIWIILLMTLGFLLGCFYALLALQRSGGSWPRFWLGNRWSND